MVGLSFAMPHTTVYAYVSVLPRSERWPCGITDCVGGSLTVSPSFLRNCSMHCSGVVVAGSSSTIIEDDSPLGTLVPAMSWRMIATCSNASGLNQTGAGPRAAGSAIVSVGSAGSTGAGGTGSGCGVGLLGSDFFVGSA